MSKFKVGDKVRVVGKGHWMEDRFKKQPFYVVSGVRDDCVSAVDDDGDELWWDVSHFELVEDVKPLIDGPGLYRTRGGDEKRVSARLFDDNSSYRDCIWVDEDGESYRPNGTWSVDPTVTDDYDIVEKIVEPAKQEEPRDYVQPPANPEAVLRQFESGATRNLDNNKLDYDGFLSPLVIEAFGKYMHSHRLQKDGTMRASSNWKKGIPDEVYMKSMWRHFFDVWKLYSGHEVLSPEDGHSVDREEALCAVLFNVQGMLHELLKHPNGGPAD